MKSFTTSGVSRHPAAWPVGLACLLALTLSPAVWAQYALTEIPNTPDSQGADVLTYGINASGQVVGGIGSTNTGFNSFVYSNGTTTNLYTSNPALPVGPATAINSSGQLTIVDNKGMRNYAKGGYLYTPDTGTIQNIGGIPYAINSAGQVTGTVGYSNYSRQSPALGQVLLYSNGSQQNVNIGSAGAGLGINDGGQITGVFTPNSLRHAFLYTNGATTDLGTLGGSQSEGTAINNAGAVAGFSTLNTSGTTHAFLYTDGSMHDLGTVAGAASSFAWAINNESEVTGQSGPDAFLYSDGRMQDLNSLLEPGSPLSLYVTLTQGVAINDSGWVVARGTDSRDDSSHSYLLQPVPLPDSAYLMIAGLLTLGAAMFNVRCNAGRSFAPA